jgi:hypothetical protein
MCSTGLQLGFHVGTLGCIECRCCTTIDMNMISKIIPPHIAMMYVSTSCRWEARAWSLGVNGEKNSRQCVCYRYPCSLDRPALFRRAIAKRLQPSTLTAKRERRVARMPGSGFWMSMRR